MQTIVYNHWYVNVDYGLGRLTADEIHSNGMRLARKLYRYRWTEECIAAIVGNVNAESGLNSGSTENPRPWGDYLPDNQEVLQSSYLRGMGFVQWTPGRDKIVLYADSIGLQWYDGDAQCLRLKWECDNGQQMPAVNWNWFVNSHADLDEMSDFWLLAYERPTPEEAEASAPERRRLTHYWYNEIHGKLHNATDYFIWSKNNRTRKVVKPPCRRM